MFSLQRFEEFESYISVFGINAQKSAPTIFNNKLQIVLKKKGTLTSKNSRRETRRRNWLSAKLPLSLTVHTSSLNKSCKSVFFYCTFSLLHVAFLPAILCAGAESISPFLAQNNYNAKQKKHFLFAPSAITVSPESPNGARAGFLQRLSILVGLQIAEDKVEIPEIFQSAESATLQDFDYCTLSFIFKATAS